MADTPIDTAYEGDPDVSGDDARPTVWPRRIFRIVLFTFLGLIALAGIILVGLNTDPGRNIIANQIEALEFENGMEIGIERIDGSIYGDMTIRGLTLSDPKGVFLSAPAVVVDWRPFAFARRHIDIRSLTAKTVTLGRLPEFRETPPSEDPLLPDYDIDIDALEIDRFIAEAPVSGERRIAKLAGKLHIADGRAQARFNGATLAGEGRAGGDRIALKLDAVPEANRLGLDVDINAPGDGVIAALAGLTEPLQVKLSGKGDWARWNGKLNAALAGKSLADLNLTARNGTFNLKGPASLARFAPPATADLLGNTTDLDVTATFEERAANVAGRVSSDAFNLTTNGLIDLSDNSFDNFKAAFVLLKPSALAPNLRGNGLRAMVTLDGPFTKPRAIYDINAARIVMNDMGVENLRARGDVQVDTARLIIPVSATAARITGLDTVAGGTLTNIRLDGDIAIDGTRFLSDNMRMRSDRIDAKLILLADTATGLYTGAIDGKIDNYRVESVGVFNIETDIDLQSEASGGFALAGKVRARSTSLTNENLRTYLGGNLTASSDVRYGSDGVARFANVRMNSPLLRITDGRGSYSQSGQIDLVASAVSQQYGPVGVTLTGTISNPRATIRAANPGLGIGLAGLTAEIRGDNGNYRIDASGQTDYGAFTADVTVATARGPLSLTINRADFAGIGLSGQVRQSPAGPFIGQLDANGRGLGGIVRLGATGKYQSAVVNLRANDTVLPGPANLRIGSAIVDATIVMYDRPEIVADVQLANTDYGSLNINAMRALIDYRDGRGKAKLLAEGTSGVPFRISGNADLQPELWRASLQGKVRGIAFRTTSPARIIPGKGTYELLPTRIDFGQGNMRVAGNYGQGIKLQSRLDDMDLAILNAFSPGLGIGGKATGSLDFAQANAGAFPTADARMTITGFSRTTAVSVSQPVNVNFVGQLQRNGGAARAVIRRRGTVIGRMNAALTPLPPGSGPWTTRLLEAPLGGGIRYNGPADTLFSLAGQPDQRLSGALGVAADFSGRVSQPSLSGIVRANNLTYENQTYGTRLTNMALRGSFTGDRLEIEQLEAVAGDGKVSATGYISLAADSGYPMDVQLKLDNARLAKSDAIGATATGNLAFTKQAGQIASLSGRILLPETRYEVIRQGSAAVPELSGVRFKPPRGRPRVTGDEPASLSAGLLGQVRLDINLVAPEKLYVSGMGLESEWSTDIQLTGTSAEPRMSGSVNLIRGTLGFAGKSFVLTEGRVGFTGGRALDPTISLVASEEVEDVTVNVNVSGRAFNPQIVFSSTPGLPQDEIMSRILFGSSVGNLSAIQAVQLAASLNSLRGTGGGLNPLGKLRSATGFDRLRIVGPDDTTGQGTSLAAGKYLTDDIYLEVITDARGFTATQLEISLTPALSVLSQAGGAVGTNVNVRYKKNY
ncbi:translocation/assembly module TamB domain-containing protein [Altererythrobacter aquiaggeris]|uniref:translocation/assembly module TamB domain-containing protein n=1 Tax=Aestuarierythrobacter aquiaggeris TaxID=1898396 RepID=UPI003017CD79